MNIINLIGLMAGTLTTISFLPQVIRICKTRSTRDISFDVSFIHDGGITMAHLWRLAGAMANHYTKHNNSDSCIDNYLFQIVYK